MKSVHSLRLLSAGILALAVAGCAGPDPEPLGAARQAAGDGPPLTIAAYYDANLFTIIFVELPGGGEAAVLQQNGSINFIYQSDACAGQIPPNGGDFISVIDAIPGDGMNPLWEEVQITFTDENPCRQFFSDDEVLAAAASGEITLDFTGEVYRCPVVGAKPLH
jgi:hypothetical protein